MRQVVIFVCIVRTITPKVAFIEQFQLARDS